MVFETQLEVRGFTKNIGKEKTYTYVNLEDISGESIKLRLDDHVNINDFQKGDSVIACIQYDSKYQSLKCIDLIKG